MRNNKEEIMDFESLGVSAPILRALREQSYEKPTPIQKQAIPAALGGRDILGLAQTGTGKTAAFSVPTIQLLAQNRQHGPKRKIRALILTPTRELAIQIHQSFADYGRYMGLKSTVVFGGVGQTPQVQALRSGVDILVATPGRLMDLVKQGYIKLDHVEIFILDEADRMLDMGFIHDIKKIIKMLPQEKQSLLFSATMPKEIDNIVKNVLKNPLTIEVAPVSSTIDTVQQSLYYVDKSQKINLLVDIFKKEIRGSVLVFTRTKHGADKVVKELTKHKISAQAIHGNKSQTARQGALENFKNRETLVLVATDIASRGIDIDELEYVVNYDLPEVAETYVHRIGRTGRAGKSGKAISFCSYQEKPLMKEIIKLIQKDVEVKENIDYPMEDFTEKTSKRKPQGARPASKESKPAPKESRPASKEAKTASKESKPARSNYRPKSQEKKNLNRNRPRTKRG